jgi:flavin reductase (DIM6/NTAB) family NADH-FMN oxidoreductase RutF
MEQANSQAHDNPIVALFKMLTHGVYVIGVTDGRTHDAFTAASVTQVSYRPLLLCLAIHPQHASYPLLLAGGMWTVSVLSEKQMELAQRFGTESPHGSNKMSGMSWGSGKSGAPFLPSALAYFDCKLVSEFPAGDHRIVVGSVVDGKVLATQGLPLRYDQTNDLDGSSQLYPAHFQAA